MMVWVCKQHGKECRSYVVSICKDFNDWGITPKTVGKLDDETMQLLKCVKWIEEKKGKGK